MRIVIVGLGKVGKSLAEQLAAEHHDVIVIDKNAELVSRIVDVYDVMGVCGNGASYDMQAEAGVDEADLLIATTSSDEVNIVACLVAKSSAYSIRSPAFVIRSMKSSCVSCAQSWDCRS